MKKIVLMLAIGGMAASSFGQGLVALVNGAASNVSTNSTLNYLGESLPGGSIGLTTGSTAAPNGYYYALLMQPYGGSGATVSSTVQNILTSGWTFAGIQGVNALGAGRFGGGASASTTAGDPTVGSPPNQFLVVGWSAGLGNSWGSITSALGLGGSGLAAGNFIGVSATGSGVGSSLVAEILFSGATGITSPITLFSTNPVPEPGTLALMALGSASLLLFRRKK